MTPCNNCGNTPKVDCSSYPDSHCVVYSGANLTRIGATTNERLDSILRKINALITTGGIQEEQDPVALAKTITLTAGTGISISEGAQTIGNNPSFTIASTITQYTDSLARAAVSLTTTGSGAATYNASTGVFNIPIPTGEVNTASNIGGGVGVFDSKAGLDLKFNSFNSSDFNIGGNVISIDSTQKSIWSNKQDTISLTTTGTSGTATFDGTTLNIPNYTYTLPTASTSILGGVKVDGTTITINSGVISAATTQSGRVVISSATWDFSQGNFGEITLSSDISGLTVTNSNDLNVGVLYVTQDATGGHTLSVNGVTPADWEILSDPSATTVVSFNNYNDTIYWSMVAQYLGTTTTTTTTSTFTTSSTTTTTTTISGDTDVNVFAAVLAADTNPFILSGTRKDRMDTLITAMKSSGVYAKMHDFGFLHLGNHADSRQHGFKGAVSPLYVSGFTFSDSGSLPGGATIRFDLNLAPSDLPQDDVSWGVVTSTVGIGAATFDGMMGVDGATYSAKLIHSSDPNIYAEINSATNANPTSHTPIAGLYSLIRPNASTEKLRVNGSTVLNRSITSGAPPTATFTLGSISNSIGGFSYPSTRNLLFWYATDVALTDIEETALKNALKTYFDAEGITAIP